MTKLEHLGLLSTEAKSAVVIQSAARGMLARIRARIRRAARAEVLAMRARTAHSAELQEKHDQSSLRLVRHRQMERRAEHVAARAKLLASAGFTHDTSVYGTDAGDGSPRVGSPDGSHGGGRAAVMSPLVSFQRNLRPRTPATPIGFKVRTRLPLALARSGSGSGRRRNSVRSH